MRLDPSHIIVPLILSLVAVVLLALHTGAEVSCADAKHQLDHGFVARAEKGFEAILAEEPGNRCAGKGMDAVVAQQCVEGDRALDGHLVSRALKSYQGILAKHPGDECAQDGVARVVKEMCGRAATLEKYKATEAAAKVYAAILEVEPLAEVRACPAKGLAQSPPPEPLAAKDGKDGKNGKNGKDGKDGKDGKNASYLPWPG